MTEEIKGQIRHVLTAGGGILVALGLMSEGEAASIADSVMAAAGAALAAWGAIWSWVDKRRAK